MATTTSTTLRAQVSRLDLIALIGKIQNVVSPKPVTPVLGNVLIEAQDDELVLSTTDLTVSMRGHISAKVTEEGAIALPARRFFQLAREITTPQIEIHATTPEIAYINAGTSHFKLQGMHKSEFPTFPDLMEGVHLDISCDTLKDLLSRTAFCAARDDSRQTLNGLLLQKSGNQISSIATDGKRLAKMHTALEEISDNSIACIIPLKAIDEITKIIDLKDEQCKLTLMADKIAAQAGNTMLISKLLSGQYPDSSRVIPHKSATPIALHREELISLLRQVSLFTTELSSAVRFTFTNGMLHISAVSGEIGEGVVNMPVNFGGEKLEIAFNPHYFLEALRHTRDETVQFSVTGPHNPGLITDSTNALFVLMPMRLD